MVGDIYSVAGLRCVQTRSRGRRSGGHWWNVDTYALIIGMDAREEEDMLIPRGVLGSSEYAIILGLRIISNVKLPDHLFKRVGKICRGYIPIIQSSWCREVEIIDSIGRRPDREKFTKLVTELSNLLMVEHTH